MLIREEKADFTVKLMCRLLDVSKSSYYDWAKQKKPDGRYVPDRNAIKAEVLKCWEGSKGAMGGWSVWKTMLKGGHQVTLWLVRRLMRELGIHGAQKQKRLTTTVPDPNAASRDDLIRRDFTSPVPTIKLSGDITYLRLNPKTTLYLAVVIDLCTRMVVGWAVADHMRAELVVDALKNAWKAGLVAQGAVFHSDKGSQYTSKLYKGFADTIAVRLSTGRKATCFDNAVSESYFATLKKEWFYRNSFVDEAELKSSLAHYIEIYYNHKRPHSTLGGNTPWEEHELHMGDRKATMCEAA
jgi:transposase InsO family protein